MAMFPRDCVLIAATLAGGIRAGQSRLMAGAMAVALSESVGSKALDRRGASP